MDYAGPDILLVVVDAFSEWIKVLPVKSALSAAIIKDLRTLFASLVHKKMF